MIVSVKRKVPDMLCIRTTTLLQLISEEKLIEMWESGAVLPGAKRYPRRSRAKAEQPAHELSEAEEAELAFLKSELEDGLA